MKNTERMINELHNTIMSIGRLIYLAHKEKGTKGAEFNKDPRIVEILTRLDGIKEELKSIKKDLKEIRGE